jgi:predicted PurR-regulated permease PerM
VEFKGVASGPWKAALAFGVVAVVLAFLYWLQQVLLLAFLALLLAILLHTLAGVGIRYLKMSRPVAVVLAAVIFIVGVLGTLSLLAVPVMQQGTALMKALPERMSFLTRKVEEYREEFPWLRSVLPSTKAQPPSDKEGPKPVEVAKTAFFTVSTAMEAAGAALATFFLGLFLAWDPERWLKGLAEVGPKGSRAWRMELYTKVASALKNYLFTVGIYMVMMGALWTVGLWLIGIDYPLLFGVIGGLVEVVPYVGPLIGLVPPLIVAITLGPMKVIFVVVLYAILHIVEGYILVPYILHRREHLPPPLVVLSILAFGSVFGVLGVILAVPLGMAGYVWGCETIYND